MYIDEARFESLLKAALQRAVELDIEEMPSDEELDEIIKPSPRFERRMRALLRNPHSYIKNQKRPVYLRILRHVAAVVIAVTTLFGATMVISPQARATVIEFVSSWSDGRTVYRTSNNTARGDWTIGYIPAGFKLQLEEDDELSLFYYYEHENDDLVRIFINIGGGSLMVGNENTTFYQTVINGRTADIYESNDVLYPSIIVIFDSATEDIICIISELDINELIKIAENIN